MKILKYNENTDFQQKELDDFIELFVERFELDDGNMGSCECGFINKKIVLQFKFAVIDKDELKTIGEICKYIKNFDNSYIILLLPNSYTEDGGEQIEMIICDIKISLTGYKNIYDDLDVWKNSKKYNL